MYQIVVGVTKQVKIMSNITNFRVDFNFFFKSNFGLRRKKKKKNSGREVEAEVSLSPREACSRATVSWLV